MPNKIRGTYFSIKCLLLGFLIFTTLAASSSIDTLRVMGDSNYPPYEYLNENNYPTGFNVDIMRAVADALNLKIHIELDLWHKVRSEIEAGNIDILMGMYNTDERDQKVDFTIPHYITSYGIFVPKGSEIKTLEDLKNKKIVVQKDDLGHDYIVENHITSDLLIKSTPEEAMLALANREADCLILPRLQGVMIIKEKNLQGITIVGPPIIQRKYCMAVTEGNASLLAKLNEGLNIIKTSGEYEKIYDKWFGIYQLPSHQVRKIIKISLLIIAPLSLLVILIFFWNWSLKRTVQQRTKELNKSRENLHITLNSIGDAVISTDIHGNITNMNPVAEKLTGTNLTEVLGNHINSVFRIVNAKSGKTVGNPVFQVLKKGKIVGLANHTELISKSGKTYQIADSAAPIKDADNKIVGVVLVFRDVTDEYRTVEKLKASEANLRTVFEAAKNIAFIKTDVNGKYSQIEVFSPGAEKIFGYKAAEIVGKPINTLLRREDMHQFSETLTIDNKDKIGIDRELQLIRKNGRRFPALFSTHHIFDQSGQMVNTICVAIDITQQKRTQEELSKIQNIKRIGTLAGGIAHDFNNILTAVYGNISIAKLKLPDSHPVCELLNEAETSINRATELTSQLLTFSKGGTPQKKSVSIEKLIEEVVSFDLSGSNVKLIIDTKPSLYPVKVDKGQIQQVFSNLAINANQAMPDGGTVTITLENFKNSNNAIPGLEPGPYLKIKFKDEGCGISQDHIHHIFDPYFTTKAAGNGLGLATVYSIIDKHKGKITVTSKINSGTTFNIYIPAIQATGSESTINSSSQLHHSEKEFHNTNILVMDDDKHIQKLAVTMLQSLGMTAETVSDGDEAIDKFKQAQSQGSPYDLVILDLTIPGGLGGKETCKKLLDLSPEAKIIVSSGYTNDTVLANYGQYGFVDMITKPYTINNLKSVIQRVMSIK